MLERLQKVKKKGGFTLVEIIVVLVILAILAALLVPRLTGWIDEAKNKAALTEGHLVLSALQAAESDLYAKGEGGTLSGADATKLEANATFKTLSTGKEFDATKITSITCSGGTVTGFKYTATNGKIISYTYNSTKGTGSFKTEAPASPSPSPTTDSGN